MHKFHWINEDIVIDFPVSKVLQNTMNEAEELDLEENPEYFCVADILDVLCKEAFVNKKITRAQWNTIVNRYPV